MNIQADSSRCHSTQITPSGHLVDLSSPSTSFKLRQSFYSSYICTKEVVFADKKFGKGNSGEVWFFRWTLIQYKGSLRKFQALKYLRGPWEETSPHKTHYIGWVPDSLLLSHEQDCWILASVKGTLIWELHFTKASPNQAAAWGVLFAVSYNNISHPCMSAALPF